MEMRGQATVPSSGMQKVIIDTDIGDDIDDVFALGLALQSPELEILGVTTAWGNTTLRARLAERLLRETGRGNIPVAIGIEKHNPQGGSFSQARWAEAGPPPSTHLQAVDFILDQIRRRPGEITLIVIGPETNIGAAIDRDPATFRKLKRVVIMGGSVRRGYGDVEFGPPHPPEPEYNIKMDVPAAQKLFTSGVPLYVMPLDSTQLKLDEVKRTLLFARSTPVTDALTLLYHQWTRETQQQTPTLFDAMAVTYAINPSLCPAEPMKIQVDDQGYTREQAGAPNAQVCLHSDPQAFFNFYMERLLRP